MRTSPATRTALSARNNTLTRAEAAQIIFELMTDESKAQYAKKAGKTFIDVGKDHWAYEAITMMTKANILVGMGDGRFDPDAVMTREQFATMIAQLFMIEINQPIGGFIFKDLNGGFADKYISFLYMLGILEGKGDNMFGPKDSPDPCTGDHRCQQAYRPSARRRHHQLRRRCRPDEDLARQHGHHRLVLRRHSGSDQQP